MNIIFYKVNDPPEKLNKSLKPSIILEGTVRGDVDKFSPNILIASDVSDYNYMYIPIWEKYYFISGCNIVRNGLYHIENVKEDVLMSFKNGLLKERVIIDKTENLKTANLYLDDGSFITSCKTITKIYNFSGGFNDSPEYILLTAGGMAE